MRPGDAPRRAHAIELAMAALTVALAVFTILVIVVPSVQPALISDRLDVAISSAAALIGLSVAGLAWVRYRELRELRALLQASAFAVLGSFNLVTVVLAISQGAAAPATGPDAGQAPILGGIVVRLTSTLLLIAGGLAGERRARLTLTGGQAILLGPSLLILAAMAVVGVWHPDLPSLLDPVAAGRLRDTPTQALGVAAGPLLLSLQLLIAAGYLVAAYLAFRDWQRDHVVPEAWLAAGLVIAAFSQVHAAIHPGAAAALVTTADLLRLGFYITLLLGLAAGRRADVRALRWANIELLQLRDADTARAALQERARLAREIHDGLAQDLWYAKLKQSRLAHAGPLSDEQTTLAHEVTDAIDAALAEARQSVAAMRLTDEGPLESVIAGYVEDYADRFGIRAVFESDGRELPALPARTQVEVLRIVQEALNNVRKHADATFVRVRLEVLDEGVRVDVVDNGRGFDPRVSDGVGFGMASMRQRALLIGAEIQIDARPRDGTRLAIIVPIRSAEGGA
ncbi:MAG: sensor histidine kinase [Chloroflexota bacterium]